MVNLRSIFSQVYFILIFLFIFVSLVGKFSSFQVYGKIHLKTVLSQSMEPTIPVGSLVITKEIESNRISVGDIVTFKAAGEQVTHRVVAIEKEKIYTKGDANEIPDKGYIQMNLEKVLFSIPKVGTFFLLIQTLRGTIALISTILTLLLLDQFIKLIWIEQKTKIVRDRRKKHEKEMVT